MKTRRMSITLKKTLCTLAAVLAVGVVWADPGALAPTRPDAATTRPSGLPPGGRKTLIMAGVWTSVCVMFPALDAKAAGFKVYAVTDASGDPSELASRTTLARFAQAGVIPTTANAVLSEIHRTWNRPEAAELAKLYALATPHYAAVMESYQKAQDVAKQ